MSARKYQSAYPGSMYERSDGAYVLAEDEADLLAALAELSANRLQEILDLKDAIKQAKSDIAVLAKALKAIAEGCSFPEDDVQKACRDRSREALAKAGV